MIGAAVMDAPPTITSIGSSPGGLSSFSVDVLPLRLGGSGRWTELSTSGNHHARGYAKPDGTFGAWGGCNRLEFDFFGSKFAIRLQASAANKFKLWVDERPHAATMQLFSGVLGTGGTPIGVSGTQNFLFDFGSAKKHRIQFEYTSTPASPADVRGIFFDPTTDIISTPDIYSPKMSFVGASYEFGIGATDVADAYPIICARALGFAHILNNDAIPSTGIIKTDATGGYGNYASHLASDLYPLSPDIVVYCGTNNDKEFVDQNLIGPQMLADLSNIRQNLPDAIIMAVSNMYIGTPDADHLKVRDQVGAAAASFGIPFVDMFDGRITDANRANYGSDSGGWHPNTPGALVRGLQLVAGLAPYLGQSL